MEMAETIANATIMLEWNQSSWLPLSSRICNEPTPRIKVISPTQSMRGLSMSSCRPRNCAATTSAAKMPIGTLMKKIHSHE